MGMPDGHIHRIISSDVLAYGRQRELLFLNPITCGDSATWQWDHRGMELTIPANECSAL